MLEIDSLTVQLPGFAVHDISFSVGQEDFFALLGPTGSGKSVILEAIMGLLPASSGHIRLGGRDISDRPPEDRKLGLVYQDHALFPHMNVQDNILFGVRYHSIPDSVTRARFHMLVDRLKLGALLQRSPTTLSGGEKQRTALARCLMLNPSGLLLDEPLSALDQVFRDDIRRLLKTLQAELAIPFILVSHSFSEVQFLANRGAVIKNGRMQQSGLVEDLFERPQSSFVASFVGMKNVFPCTTAGGTAKVNGIRLHTNGRSRPGDTHLVVRPEEIDLLGFQEHSYDNALTGHLTELDCHGFYFTAHIDVGQTTLQAFWSRQTVKDRDLKPGTEVSVGFPARAVHTFAEPGEGSL